MQVGLEGNQGESNMDKVILYFLRHGIAVDRLKWRGDDADRPLTAAGSVRLKRTAITLASLSLDINRIVSSPLLRARQTADIVAGQLHLPRPVECCPALSPGFNTQALAKVVGDTPRSRSLLLVGHEPDFSETVGALIGQARLVIKKGGLCRVDITQLHPLAGELLWLLPPKILAQRPGDK